MFEQPAGRPRRLGTRGLVALVIATVAVIVGVVVVVRVAADSGRDEQLQNRSGGRSAVTLNAAGRDGDQPTGPDLQRTATLLQARLTSSGVDPVTVTVAGGSIVVTAPADKVDQVKAMTVPALLHIRPLRAGPFPTTTDPTTGPGAPAAPGGPSDPTAYPGTTPAQAAQLAALDCAKPPPAGRPAQATAVVAACDTDATYKLLLDKAILDGSAIKDVQAQLDQQATGGWQLQLTFTNAGQAVWTDYTAGHNATVTPNDTANKVAILVDGKVLSYPEIQTTINGPASITGNFDKTAATDLANALRHGALPLLLTVTSITPVN